ncbi:Riboflavin transporter [Pseudovibrio axinellae]|uniref:Riboflavin transporter n=1 Tax=Pseudovibrio axinellae TaxID=989403 RepID=A0A165XR86_9HYPH|nr:DMT family transporter [Pseudovibrio axinellae]KZL17963.1 Riboflavin transporter [Pseudovibrio axinellae]SER15149.1 EamA-like transporter family protein [Pseudovibrio axinellae]
MSNNMQGILWALLATALFAITAAMAKVAAAHYHVLQILFFRQCFVLASALPILGHTFPQGFKTKHPLLHVFRLLGAFLALSSGIWAVALLPLTTATTLAFAQVFFVALLAAVFLEEKLTPARITGVLFGFLGVLVVMRPGMDGLSSVYTLVPVAGALGAAIAVICVRHLSQTETTATLLVYQAVFVGLLAGIPLFWLWKTPDLQGFFLLTGMAIIATLGQWVGVKALRLGEASVVGTVEYMKLIYAALLGFVIFAETPDTFTLLGAALIMFSALYMMRQEQRQKALLKPT